MREGLVRTEHDVTAYRSPGDSVSEACLVDGAGYAEAMTQRMMRWTRGRCRERVGGTNDQLVYVLAGRGHVYAGGRAAVLEPGTAVFVPAGESWVVEAEGPDDLLASCTSVPAPPGPSAVALRRDAGPWRLTRVLGAQERQAATSDREFAVLHDPSTGSGGATQFVGFIPRTGAPTHYHLYDEICVIVRGAGTLRVGDTTQELGPGSTFHVPPRLLHAVENTGTSDLWILGVFRPAGSAAAAYYPDGRRAPNYVDD